MRGIALLLRNYEKITGVWAQNDIIEAGLIKEWHKRRISASDDMSVIGMDDVSLASMMTPALTTIKQPFKEMSQKAVDMVIRQKEDNMVSDKKIVLEASLVIRETTAEVKQWTNLLYYNRLRYI